MLPIAAAGLVKWLVALALVAYLKTHGLNPVWGLAVGLVVGAVILVIALIPHKPDEGS